MPPSCARRVAPSVGNGAERHATAPAKTRAGPGRTTSYWTLLLALFNWVIWGFVVIIVMSQFLGVVWNSTSSITNLEYGQSPLLSTHEILGQNDEPYSDRMIVCLLRGRLYRAAQLSAVLAQPSTVLLDSTGGAINGYRVVKRNQAPFLTSTYTWYSETCAGLAVTLDGLIDSCTALGYNVTRDALRIVDDLESKNSYLIPNSLPVLVMPYWDNTRNAHCIIPGWDGSACAFRLAATFPIRANSTPTLFGPDRSVRERLTTEWLKRPDGVWRNGWLEDSSGSKWYSDMATSDLSEPLGINNRQFDITSGREFFSSSGEFVNTPSSTWWGNSFNVVDTPHNVLSVAISNGKRFGLFLYKSSPKRVVMCLYDLETFISNWTVGLLLVRWMVAMATLQTSYWRRKCTVLENAGIGCLSNSRNFLLLPIILVPRLKQTLTAFFSAGCYFEGDQFAFSEAWFVIYPAIIESMLLYFSLLNSLARLLRRRMSDALFGPTLVLFCLIHYTRNDIAKSGWFEIDGRISALITAHDFESLQLLDFVSSNIALRINGNVRRLFIFKIALLALNLLPLLVSKSVSVSVRRGTRDTTHHIEEQLAVRACCLGGIGAPTHQHHNRVCCRSGGAPVSPGPVVLSSYELLRIGYVVLGDTFLMSVTDWVYFSAFGGHEWVRQLIRYRIMVMEVTATPDGHEVAAATEFVLLNDSRLRHLHFWELSAVPFK